MPGQRSYLQSVWLAFLKLLAGIHLISDEGISRGSIVHKRLKRTFRIYSPADRDKYGKMPLVIILHGRGGNGESMILLTRKGFNRLADRDGFLVLYPDGIELNWNDGRLDEQSHDRAHDQDIDDVGFISALTDLMINDYSADPERVYITGISNGAIMAYRLACELSQRIAAIAPVDGSIPRTLIPNCNPSQPVPVLAINNTDDPLVPFDGGNVHGNFSKIHLGEVLSVNESVEFWVKRNDCTTLPVEDELEDKDPEDGIKVTRKHFLNKTNGNDVILYTVHGGGHTWPGGLQYLPARMIGKTCMDFDANEVIWSFFKNHRKY